MHSIADAARKVALASSARDNQFRWVGAYLMAPALFQALKLSSVKVVLQDGLVVWVGALLDDDARALLGAQTTDVGETLLGDDDVEIVLGLEYRCQSVVLLGEYCSRLTWSMCVHMGTMQETPVGSVLEGRVEGVCMMEYFALGQVSFNHPSRRA